MQMLPLLVFVPCALSAIVGKAQYRNEARPSLPLPCVQVIGVFLESAEPAEQEAAKKVAREQPQASVADLEAKGISFATSRM